MLKHWLWCVLGVCVSACVLDPSAQVYGDAAPDQRQSEEMQTLGLSMY